MSEGVSGGAAGLIEEGLVASTVGLAALIAADSAKAPSTGAGPVLLRPVNSAVEVSVDRGSPTDSRRPVEADLTVFLDYHPMRACTV